MWRTALTTIGLIAFVTVGVMSFGNRTTLIAKAQIEVADRAIADPQETKIVGTIAEREEVPVLSCVDLKHYIAPKVRLKNGITGFVLVGEFELKRHSPWSWSSQAPVSFGC